MAKINMVPVVIQQMIEDLRDKSVPEHVKFNKLQVLQSIKDECEAAIAAYKKGR